MGVKYQNIARRVDSDVLDVYHDQTTRLLRLDKSTANEIKLMGGGAVSGDDLRILPNITNTTPKILLQGAGSLLLDVATGASCYIQEGGASFLKLYENGTDDTIEGATANNDLFLSPNGTGVLKFGTHVALGGAALSGKIAIKDSAGNTRYLGVVS